MKTFRRVVSALLSLCVALTMFTAFSTSEAKAELQDTHDYHYIEPGSEFTKMAIPKTFTVRNTVSKIDCTQATFLEPQDMYIDDEDNIYVLDWGGARKAGRIVKMDMWGNVSLEITTITCEECALAETNCTHTKKTALAEPRGIFVLNNDSGDPAKDQHIFIADTKNSRVVHLDRNGYFVEEFFQPDDPAISGYPFDVTKVSVDSNGIMYLLMATDFQGFMKLNTKGEYVGNTGMTWTTTSLTEYLWSKLSSSNDIVERASLTAPPYSNFYINDEGWIYATVIQVDKDQVCKLNTSGTNVFPPAVYGRSYRELTDEKTWASRQYASNFVDITVDEKGIVYALDSELGNVFLYDQEGNNLAFFGSKGTYRGRFQKPVAIGLLKDGSVVVLDNQTGFVTTFKPTEFCNLMKEGTYQYYEAEYETARSIWSQLLEIDGNYVYAHRAIGKAYFKEKNYDKAMEEYKLADDKEGYSLSFEKKKNDLTDKYFFVLVLIIVVALVVVIISYKAIKKYVDKLHVKLTTWGGDV